MKYNFEKFKKRTSYYHRCDFTNEVKEWFEGYEKEIREMHSTHPAVLLHKGKIYIKRSDLLGE